MRSSLASLPARGQRKGKLQTSSGEGERQPTKTQGNLGQPQERLQKQQASESAPQQRPEQQEERKSEQAAPISVTEKKEHGQDKQEDRKPTPSPQPLAPKNKALLEKPFISLMLAMLRKQKS